MFSDWVSFLAYPNLFGIKGFVVVVVVENAVFNFIYGARTAHYFAFCYLDPQLTYFTRNSHPKSG
jgi:hypothetical protein